jgi:hypothetical protein
MQLDPDQREWLYNEEQERLLWKRKLRRQPQKHAKWIAGAAAAVVALGIVTAIVTSDSFAELIARIRH